MRRSLLVAKPRVFARYGLTVRQAAIRPGPCPFLRRARPDRPLTQAGCLVKCWRAQVLFERASGCQKPGKSPERAQAARAGQVISVSRNAPFHSHKHHAGVYKKRSSVHACRLAYHPRPFPSGRLTMPAGRIRGFSLANQRLRYINPLYFTTKK